ncbi:hypothetical protein FHS76_000212 [Ochrobactrum daejeonense]|uniref:Uncharacterized protein n=1 Tax=Brucella daejeonensis TaxID=659015 RepID=A0A7W9ATP0_9HYPH|nr:hypothetical protein [Brucella daejeonensis]
MRSGGILVGELATGKTTGSSLFLGTILSEKSATFPDHALARTACNPAP